MKKEYDKFIILSMMTMNTNDLVGRTPIEFVVVVMSEAAAAPLLCNVLSYKGKMCKSQYTRCLCECTRFYTWVLRAANTLKFVSGI